MEVVHDLGSLSLTLGNTEGEEEPGTGVVDHLRHQRPGLLEPEPVLCRGVQTPGVPGQEAGLVLGADPQVSLVLVLVDGEVTHGGVGEERDVLEVFPVSDTVLPH